MQETSEPTLLNHGLKFGLILGFAQVAVYLLLYIIDRSLLVSFIASMLQFVGSLLLIAWPMRSYKKLKNGLLSFRDGLVLGLLTITGGALVTVVFNYILYNLIDPGLGAFIKKSAIEKAVSMMEKLGATAEDIDKSIAPLMQQDFMMTPAKLPGLFFQTIMIYAIPVLIIAAVFKSAKRPSEEF